MAIKFDAYEVSVTGDFGVHVIAIVGPKVGEPDLYMMVQYEDSYSDQDVQLGMVGPYIEFCGQAWSWYGHIAYFGLSRDRIQVKMDNFAASEMKNDGEFEVRFALDDRQFTNLRNALEKAFRDQAYFHEIN